MEHNPLVWLYVFARFLSIKALGLVDWRETNTVNEIFLADENGEGLSIVLDGYASQRSLFARQVRAFVNNEKRCRYRCVYAPHINYDRNDTILEANTHILGTIFTFCADYPGEHIDLIGISAGGRLAIGLLFLLRRQNVRVRTVTIASPLNGTSLVRLVPGAYHVAKALVGDTLINEFDPQQSNLHMDLANNVALSESNRTFLHFYGTSDWIVFPPHRCTTAVGPPYAYYKALHACSHHEIFDAAMQSTELWDFLCD